MIVVDSSIWIDAHRHPHAGTATVLKELLDADEVALALPVRLELIAGISPRDRAALVRGLSALPLLHPSGDTWATIERWVPEAARRGQRFGLSDWLIAALADDIGALVWSADADFARLELLKMVRRFSP